MPLARILTAAFLLLSCSAPGFGQDITLSSRDNGISVTGRLLEFDGEFYRLETRFGPLTLDGSAVTCSGEACPGSGSYVAQIGIAGPETLVFPMLPVLIDAFATSEGYGIERTVGGNVTLFDSRTGNEAARFLIRTMDQNAADKALLNGAVQIAVGYVLTGEQRQTGLIERVVALDAVVPMVALSNDIREITFSDLARAATGEIETWSELGRDDVPIALAVPAPGTPAMSMLAEFLDLAPGSEIGARLQANIEGNPFSLSIRPLSQAGSGRSLDLLGPCGMVSEARPEDIATGRYPLVLQVRFAHLETRLPRILSEFVEFVESEAGRESVRSANFGAENLLRIPFAEHGEWLADSVLTGLEASSLSEIQRLARDLRSHDRLAIAFRFDGGDTRLDTHSLSGLRRLARLIEQGLFDGERIVLAGFSDGVGDAEANLRLSQERAEHVRRELLSELSPARHAWRDVVVAVGYGEIAPIACDEVAWGRRLNRRVEVWIGQR